MPTETITCTDCRGAFEFTERDQKFYEEMQYTKPRRCKPCRDARKAKNNSAQPSIQAPAGIKRVEWTNGNDAPPSRNNRDRKGDRRRHDDY